LDVVLDDHYREIFRGDLGSYDPYSHYLRLDGGEDLFYLCGTAPEPWKNKFVHRFSDRPGGGLRWPWDGEGRQRLSSSACLAADGSITISSEIYAVAGVEREFEIENRDARTGRRIWSLKVPKLVVAMAAIGEAGLVYTLKDGSMGLIDTGSATIVQQWALESNKNPTAGLSLSARGSEVAVGTLDGRILLYRLC
jgi:outer membrane protein assembly factor BamB